MGDAPDPRDVYDRAKAEGERRLAMSLAQQTATGFIAGLTIVFGIVALAVTTALAEPALGQEAARLAGALAFGIGVVFLIVGRSELFSENFFDPVAAAIDDRERVVWLRLLRLWLTILVLNLVGGAVLLAVLTVDGAMPVTSTDVLVRIADEIADRHWTATLARAVLAGALITLLSYLLKAADSVVARILVAFMVGFLLALGPFDHVVVSALHVLFGAWQSDLVGYGDVARNAALAAAGNLVGGVVLMTLTHTAQVRSR